MTASSDRRGRIQTVCGVIDADDLGPDPDARAPSLRPDAARGAGPRNTRHGDHPRELLGDSPAVGHAAAGRSATRGRAARARGAVRFPGGRRLGRDRADLRSDQAPSGGAAPNLAGGRGAHRHGVRLLHRRVRISGNPRQGRGPDFPGNHRRPHLRHAGRRRGLGHHRGNRLLASRGRSSSDASCGRRPRRSARPGPPSTFIPDGTRMPHLPMSRWSTKPAATPREPSSATSSERYSTSTGCSGWRTPAASSSSISSESNRPFSSSIRRSTSPTTDCAST